MNAVAQVPKVFVIDDDASIRELLGWLMKRNSIAFETFADARSFLAAYVPGTPGCLVLDLYMPGMNGFELAEAIRADARCAQIPIIALSSITSPATIERGRQAGFHDFVAKFDRQGLIAALKESTVEFAEAA